MKKLLLIIGILFTLHSQLFAEELLGTNGVERIATDVKSAPIKKS